MSDQLNMNRRQFIKNTGMAGIATGIGLNWKKTTEATHRIGWTQAPLAYSYNALEPVIDAKTMEIHYSAHAAGYTKNLAAAAKEEGVSAGATTLEDLLAKISLYSDKMRNNAGGHYNHELFWKSLQKPVNANRPSLGLETALKKGFGSLESFQKTFTQAAATKFGSGWAWLVLNPEKQLVVTATSNQDNPLMDIAVVKGIPLLGLDVWEHAYYLKYQNKRAEYIKAWWALVNWEFIEQQLNTFL